MRVLLTAFTRFYISFRKVLFFCFVSVFFTLSAFAVSEGKVLSLFYQICVRCISAGAEGSNTNNEQYIQFQIEMDESVMLSKDHPCYEDYNKEKEAVVKLGSPEEIQKKYNEINEKYGVREKNRLVAESQVIKLNLEHRLEIIPCIGSNKALKIRVDEISDQIRESMRQSLSQSGGSLDLDCILDNEIDAFLDKVRYVPEKCLDNIITTSIGDEVSLNDGKMSFMYARSIGATLWNEKSKERYRYANQGSEGKILRSTYLALSQLGWR